MAAQPPVRAAGHDAWSPYDGYAAPPSSFAVPHPAGAAGRADAAPVGPVVLGHPGCDAVTAMQRLVCEAMAQGKDAVDPDTLAEQVNQ